MDCIQRPEGFQKGCVCEFREQCSHKHKFPCMIFVSQIGSESMRGMRESAVRTKVGLGVTYCMRYDTFNYPVIQIFLQ